MIDASNFLRRVQRRDLAYLRQINSDGIIAKRRVR
jgi:hypothetical protein